MVIVEELLFQFMYYDQPEGGSQGQASEVLSESEEVMRIRRQVGRIYAYRTGQPLSRISRDGSRFIFVCS
jgi:ATP-dependent Clp protease protease subunit